MCVRARACVCVRETQKRERAKMVDVDTERAKMADAISWKMSERVQDGGRGHVTPRAGQWI